MHMKTIRSKFLAGLLGLATSIAMVAMPAQAAQVLKPAYVSGATSAPATPNDINALTLTVPKGQYVTFDVMYSVTAPNGANESGLGLKVRYDSAFFDEMTADTLSATTPPTLVTAGSYRTDVTNLLTKCMIASPSPQEIVGGTQREVVFGWIDTSIRRDVGGAATGEVGWTGSADPAAPGAQYGCLNPGYPGGSPAGGINGSTAAPAYSPTTGAGVKLFTMRLKVKSTATVGATSVVNITTGNNYSFANYASNNGFTPPSDKSFTISAAAAPAATLISVASRKVHSTTAAATTPAFDFVFWQTSFGAIPVSVAAAAPVKTEPRTAVNAGAVGTAGHQIVFKYSAAVSGTPVVTTAVGTASNVVAVGDEVRFMLTGVPDMSRVLVTVNGVGDDKSVAIGFLQGNVNSFTTANMQVNSTDIGQVKGQSLVTVTSANFVFDVNASGVINSTDIGLVKGKSLNQLP